MGMSSYSPHIDYEIKRTTERCLRLLEQIVVRLDNLELRLDVEEIKRAELEDSS